MAGRLAPGRLFDQKGISRPGCLLSLVFALLAAYTAVLFIGTEIDYRSLASEMQRIARAAGETPDEGLAAQVRTKATELGLPPAAGRTTIRRSSGNQITMTVQYPDSLTFFGRWHWVWDRRIQIDQTYTRF